MAKGIIVLQNHQNGPPARPGNIPIVIPQAVAPIAPQDIIVPADLIRLNAVRDIIVRQDHQNGPPVRPGNIPAVIRQAVAVTAPKDPIAPEERIR